MISERAREAKEFRAKGSEIAQKIRAEADKEKTVILAEATRKSEILRGEGESSAISIYANAFENIELTSTDMMVTQSGVPYPIVVPSFPKLTNDDKLDYGKKMELLNEN